MFLNSYLQKVFIKTSYIVASLEASCTKWYFSWFSFYHEGKWQNSTL